ncbi:MAG TPA: OmpA family protein [Rhodoblastus sp.]|nr:OmpA family protein [Rhodoblastus sp.]
MNRIVFLRARSRVFYSAFLVSFATAFATAAWADFGFPADMRFPPQIVIDPDQSLQVEAVGVAEIATNPQGDKQEFKGRHYARWLRYKPAPGEPAPGYYNGTEERIFTAMRSVLTRDGWEIVHVSEAKDSFAMRRARDGRELRAAVRMDAPQAQVFIELIESGAEAAALVIPAPSPNPERTGVNVDLAWLPPWPGSKRTGGGGGGSGIEITPPGSGQTIEIVGSRVETRDYQGPLDLSQIQFIGGMRAGLEKAGWEIVYPKTAEAARDYASLVAHYARGKRDIWIKLTHQQGAYSYTVTDLGADDWAARLKGQCHVALEGVFFDFDKATLRTESGAALSRAAEVLSRDPGLKVEVQGHTDNVGGDDYNLKLSDARAASVRTWLGRHGVDPGRLASRGYGKTTPVADNSTDLGRARNRRVELALPNCRK